MINLREIESDDISIINSWRNNKDLVNFLGDAFRYITKEVDQKWFENYLGNRDKNVRLIILEDDKPIGMVNLLNIDMLNQYAEFSIQIGDFDKHSKGVGTEVTKMMLDHGFNNLNLYRIDLTVLNSNKRAIKVYEKCGFQIEGKLRSAVYKNGKFEDMIIMGILKKDFKR